MNFSFVHEFGIDPDGYWKIFLAPEFNKDMFGELKMKKYEVLVLKDDGKHFHREQVCEPSTPVPSFLQLVVKSTGYTEIDDMDWGTGVMKIKIQDGDVQRLLLDVRRLHRQPRSTAASARAASSRARCASRCRSSAARSRSS